MENMFSGHKKKTVPKNLKECYQTDSVTHNLWTWAERLEKFGQIFAIFVLIAIIIVAFALLIDSGDGWIFLLFLITAPLSAFLEYISFHILALLIGSLASIVQHTKITANLNLYNSSKEYTTNDNTEKSAHGENNKTNITKSSSSVIQPPYWCANCGTEGPFEDKCPQCGRRIKTYTKPQPKTDTAKNLNNLKKYWDCEKCGATNLETERHCWSCGANKE